MPSTAQSSGPASAKENATHFRVAAGIALALLVAFAALFAFAGSIGVHFRTESEALSLGTLCYGTNSSSLQCPSAASSWGGAAFLVDSAGVKVAELWFGGAPSGSSPGRVLHFFSGVQLLIPSFQIASADFYYRYGGSKPVDWCQFAPRACVGNRPSVWISPGTCSGPVGGQGALECPQVIADDSYAPSTLEVVRNGQPGDTATFVDLEMNNPVNCHPSGCSQDPAYAFNFTIEYSVRITATNPGSNPFDLVRTYSGNVSVPLSVSVNYTVAPGSCIVHYVDLSAPSAGTPSVTYNTCSGVKASGEPG